MRVYNESKKNLPYYKQDDNYLESAIKAIKIEPALGKIDIINYL